MSEADRLKDDVQNMLRGLRPMRQQAEEQEEEAEDLDDAKNEAQSELCESIKEILDQTFTVEALRRMCDEKGITQKIGQIGVKEVADNIREALQRGFEDHLENYG